MMAAAMTSVEGGTVALALFGFSGVCPLHFAHLKSIGEYQAKVFHRRGGS